MPRAWSSRTGFADFFLVIPVPFRILLHGRGCSWPACSLPEEAFPDGDLAYAQIAAWMSPRLHHNWRSWWHHRPEPGATPRGPPEPENMDRLTQPWVVFALNSRPVGLPGQPPTGISAGCQRRLPQEIETTNADSARTVKFRLVSAWNWASPRRPAPIEVGWKLSRRVHGKENTDVGVFYSRHSVTWWSAMQWTAGTRFVPVHVSGSLKPSHRSFRRSGAAGRLDDYDDLSSGPSEDVYEHRRFPRWRDRSSWP